MEKVENQFIESQKGAIHSFFSTSSGVVPNDNPVASAERSFSKLKWLKNYLRSTMSKKRLNGLAMCTIERDILDTTDLNTILDDFASRNA